MDKKFAEEVHQGLTSTPKRLPSKYFYDKQGDKIFQQIMELDEYYLTRAEYDILETHHESLLEQFSSNGEKAFQLIEFGAGDGTKTKILLTSFLKSKADFEYVPVDISGSVLETLMEDLKDRFPSLNCHPVQDDYFHALKQIDFDTTVRKVILFLGSNIGNFTPETAHDFIDKLAEGMNSGDQVLIGFDLKKDPHILIKAYDDEQGVTAEFNYNLLRRINRELCADFNIEKFRHFARYDPVSGAMESFLISIEDQSIQIEGTGEEYTIDAWEAIHTEISQKFDFRMIENLAKASGFRIVKHYLDHDEYFVDSLWELE